MSKTITKSIGEGHDSGELYAALAYNASDKFEGMKIKSLMLNEDEKIYLRDTSTYIYSDSSGSLQIVGTTVSITGTIVPNYTAGFLMAGTAPIQFYDTGLYIYSSADGQLDLVADTVLALASTTITLTGAITVTGAPTITGNVVITGTVGITGDVTMATTDQINFYDSGAYIQASASTALAIVGTTIAITGASTHTGGLTMATTSRVNFADANAYIYSSTSTQLDIVATSITATGTFDVTGNSTITGTVGITGATTIATTSKVQFRDTGIYLYSSVDGTLNIVADTVLALAATTVTITGATDHTGAFEMQTTSRLQFHDTGMYIYASGDGALAIVSDTTLTITCPNITIGSTSRLQFLDTGLYIYSSANGVLDIVSDTTLNITSPAIVVTGAPTITGALTVGVDATGHDVTFYAETAGYKWVWDQNQDTNGGMLVVGTSQFTGAITVGINDTGHDVKLFGATSGAYLLWDESADDLILVGAAGLVIGAAAVGITFNGANTTACISMDGATLANGDHEIEMRNNVVGDKTIIASGAATDDAGIVTAVGADADIADGSLYMSCTDGAGALFIKIDDVWTAVTV